MGTRVMVLKRLAFKDGRLGWLSPLLGPCQGINPKDSLEMGTGI